MVRVDLRDSDEPGISALFAAAGVAVTVGLAEFAHAALAGGATSLELQSGLLLVCAVYAALGALAGLVCWMAQRVWAAPAAALAALATIAAAGTQPTALQGAAALALGLVVLRVAAAALGRAPSLPRARLASSAALLALAGLCALAARALPAYGPRWALGAAVAAAGGAILTWTPRVRGSALLLAGASLYLVAQGAAHVQRLKPSVRPAANAPSVLLVTIGALRADHVGVYGHASARTPNLDALAAQGARFTNAYTPSVVSGPAHAALLSGRSPLALELLTSHQGLGPDVETLAEALARAGYVTGAFPSTPALADRASGLASRFQFVDADLREHREFPEAVYRCVAIRPLERRLKGPATWASDRPARPTTDRALQFLSAHAAAPTFTWVHYGDPELPYLPPAELRAPDARLVSGDWRASSASQQRALAADAAQLAAMRGLYDAEVASVDRELGRLLEAARENAPAGGLLIVVTSDRGEALGEHGHYWDRDLHDATLRVPLLMLPPPRVVSAPRVVSEVVRAIDVAPTILDWLGLPELAGAEGASLSALAAGNAAASPGPAIALLEPEPDGFGARAAAVRRDGWKLIWRADGMWAPGRWAQGSLALYDVASDPAEASDLAAVHPEVVRELAALLPAGWAPALPPQPAAPPPAEPRREVTQPGVAPLPAP